MNVDSKDRWVLLGGLGSKCNELLLNKIGNSYWISDLNDLINSSGEENDSGSELYSFKENIWTDLLRICDGIKFDSFVEVESEFIQELNNLFPQIEFEEKEKKEINKVRRVKIYVWYNFGVNFLTSYNCKRGIFTLSNSGTACEVISHLKSTFSLEFDEKRKSILELFTKLVIQGDLFSDLTSSLSLDSQNQSRIEEATIETSFCYSKCKVLNCIEHLEFTSDLINGLSIRNVMNYLSKELLSIGNYDKNQHGNEKIDVIASVLRNEGYFYQNLNIKIPIEIWCRIFDFLDDDSLSQVSTLNQSFKYIWLIYHRNDLLPHQRRSVIWLLERESHSKEGHWLFENPIKYLTSSQDVFKYLSIWHYLRICDVSQIVNSENLEKIIWDNNQSYLMGIKTHPKFLASNISYQAFQRKSSIALYINHTNKIIHLGFCPKSRNEFRVQEYSQTQGGIFCDEPGLGKTLTVLSLISKTSNKVSNIHKDDGISYFEYPFGVKDLLYKINQPELGINFMTSHKVSPIKLVNISTQDESHPQYSYQNNAINKNLDLIPTGATLIIVPNHLIQHWIEEIKKWYKTDTIVIYNGDIHSNKSISTSKRVYPHNYKSHDSNHDFLIYIFDDPSKDEIIQPYFLAQAKAVILSYRMLTKQFQLCKVKQKYKRAFLTNTRAKNHHDKDNKQDLKDPFFRQEMSPILRIKWLRLIIDEGHNIGNSEISSTLYQQFIFKIKSEFKWIMSGTPLPISIIKSINTNIPNILKFLQLPIICDKTRNYEQESIRDSRRSYKMDYDDNNNANLKSIQEPSQIYYSNNSNSYSILKLISKSSIHGKLSPIGIFTVFTQIASIVVLNQKNQCLRNYLPNLIGPIKKVIQPFIDNEFYIYNIICELTQRNLFCTYFSQDNIDSLLHPCNLNYRQEVIWNFRFASILGFTMNIKDFILDDNKLHLIKNMNLSIPYISVSIKDIQELRLMLENKHPNYENDHFYQIESISRMEFVLDYFTNIKLSPPKSSNSFYYYNCDSCNEIILFPLIIPCPKLHLVCTYCIMEKHGYIPIHVNLNISKNCNSSKKKLFWNKRGPIQFCIVCGKHVQINSDFFDRLQVPIQISHIELKNDDSISNLSSSSSSVPNSCLISNHKEYNNMIPLFNFPLIAQLKMLLTKDYKSNEIEKNIVELYQKFTDITVNNINNYLYNYIHSFGNSLLPFIDTYQNIPLISIGLISLSSSKLRYILHCILKDIEENPKIKIMIVSSLWQQLDFLYYTLTILFNIGTCRYYPNIPKSELQRSISNFKKDYDNNIQEINNQFPVLLLSIDIGSHGLDLSCVSNIYILDPISDESIENQTISRAYRIRSNSSTTSSFVKVKYCLIQDTFEDMLYDYIQYKRFIFQDNSKKSSLNNCLKEDDLDKVKRSSKRRKRNSISSSSSSYGGNSHIRKNMSLDSSNIINNSNSNPNPNHIFNTQESSFLDLDPTQLLLRIFLK
ncbi:SNF2 family N-terminal domain protein [Cryptosporidium meleagridis]|uniref:SNF2 family N-terminal domain protein n=1 Tax=Cryptosporidium meleagridis TaxID=93969 RepID=A0A2P4Z1C6_9CRYT|nr:SNF2 family N-terminal domain protein [Cryptosporidium meleagridis]